MSKGKRNSLKPLITYCNRASAEGLLGEKKKGQKKFFQVAWDVSDPKTIEREKRALEGAMKELKIEGELITLESYLRQGASLKI